MNTCLNCQKETKNRKYCCRDCAYISQQSNPKRCKLCNNIFPKRITVDGKKISCQKRKYCFDCSPFGLHNTRILNKSCKKRANQVDFDSKKCINCKRLHTCATHKCAKCYFDERKNRVMYKIYNIVGSSCWICGYNKTIKNLCFHHIDPTTKKFCLSTRETMLKWERVWKEMQKCILICHNCHGEIHAKIISDAYVQDLFQDKWKQIHQLGPEGIAPS